MLRLSSVVNVGLGVLLVVPAVALQGKSAGSLAESLQQTITALEQLADLDARVQKGDYTAVAAIVQQTEPAPADAVRAERELTSLRESVASLQTDADPSLVTALAPTLVPDRTPGTQGPLTPGETTPHVQRTTLEPEGYIADPMLFARACYRGARYGDALAALQLAKDSPEVRYWTARCLDRLDRLDEAAQAFQALIDSAPQSTEARLAVGDLEFLRWRRKLRPAQTAPAVKQP
jgi:tetratricopeptide (TPR) repeat protein